MRWLMLDPRKRDMAMLVGYYRDAVAPSIILDYSQSPPAEAIVTCASERKKCKVKL